MTKYLGTRYGYAKGTSTTNADKIAAMDKLGVYEDAEENGLLVKDVVRCEKCVQSKQDRDVGLYCNMFKQYRNADDYCSSGKRKVEQAAHA